MYFRRIILIILGFTLFLLLSCTFNDQYENPEILQNFAINTENKCHTNQYHHKNKWKKGIQFTKGLHEIKDGIYAYLQPDGGWGLNNTGLITDGNEALLIDTMNDLILTSEMLAEVYKVTDSITYVVTTHAHNDHYYGNQLVHDSEIITTNKIAAAMPLTPPQMMQYYINLATEMAASSDENQRLEGEYILKIFGNYEYSDIMIVEPDTTFDNSYELQVGNKYVKLIEIENTHSSSDILVYLPEDKILFAADLCFVNVTPIVWHGPVENWINVLDFILTLDVDIIVPGHGPVTDKKGIKELKKYFTYTYREARKRFNAGMTAYEAALDINLKKYNTWADRERIVFNVHNYFNDFMGQPAPVGSPELYFLTAHYYADLEKQ